MPTAKLAFSPDSRRVNQVRLLISNMVLLALDDRAAAARIAMVAAELSEHLVEHALGQLSLQIDVNLVQRDVKLTFQAELPGMALQELMNAVDDTAEGDPVKVFSRELAAVGRDRQGVSLRMRLARIRCEGGMMVWCGRGENGRAQLVAEPSHSPLLDAAPAQLAGSPAA
jgi:hypothetical protein